MNDVEYCVHSTHTSTLTLWKSVQTTQALQSSTHMIREEKAEKIVDKIKRPFKSSLPYIYTWRSIWNVYERTGWKTAHVTRAIPIWIDSMREKKESFENHSQICAWFWQQHPYTFRNAHTHRKHWWRRLNNKRKMRKS